MSDTPTGPGVEAADLARVALVAVAAAAVWFRVWEPFPSVSVIGLAAALIGGYPIFKEAAENLLARRMTMELSMTIALAAALVIGEFFTALVITLFVLVAEILEGLTVDRGRRAIRHLLAYLPRAATVRRNGQVREVPMEALRAGDRVLVNPGGAIPVDGSVVGGASFVDQAAITGESMPVEKGVGSTVYAGTINQSGALEIRADQVGRDTSFGKIVDAVERAERSRAPVQKTADRLAGYIVYVALAAAVLTFLVTRDVRSTISVIIVAGACGIAAGTPLAILGAIGQAARQGAIVKGGLYLEALASTDTVVLDKTGTVTFGTPSVRAVVPAAETSEEEVIRAAALAERRSEHPLAKAILARAEQLGLPPQEPERFTYTPGRGVVAELAGERFLVGNEALLAEQGVSLSALPEWRSDGASPVFVARGTRLLGVIQVADALRSEATAAVGALRAMGIRTILLSGDVRAVAEAVARQLGTDEVGAELLPDQKQLWVTSLVEQGRKVAMVGDGINDAPALAAASVGVAMGSGTDVARESADVVLLGNDLGKFVETVRVARRTRRIILQNFAGTLAVDAVGMGLAAVGLLNPLLAAFIHVASELAFILNSARLLPASAPRS
ncbi:MAG TPA: cation-translocating P-type ATPase [Gemmatimonadales bacterium]|nr:cation-translocating P-type ATPase [Gemmatimonadales bacterium]